MVIYNSAKERNLSNEELRVWITATPPALRSVGSKIILTRVVNSGSDELEKGGVRKTNSDCEGLEARMGEFGKVVRLWSLAST